MENISTSVVICGAGPVGLVLAHLLSQEGIHCVVIEQLDGPVVEPRAIALDAESLRTLQKLELLADFEPDLLSGLEAEYVNGEGVKLFRVGQPEYRPYGYCTINSFDQPRLDRYLSQKLKASAFVTLRYGHELTNLNQSEQGVQVLCRNAAGNAVEIAAEYLIGCDGGRSTVRSLLGISMQGESNPQPWLVIDTRDAHLADKLDCRFFCDPKRPGMTIRKQRGERRWEWMLMPGEAREALLVDAKIRSLIAPYTDAAQVDIYRKRVYDFHALIAEKWRDGRVFLAGDAAHMTPPFAGQGLNSGMRDVANLGWKLALVLKGMASPGLLNSYEKDRRGHAWELIQTALDLGAQIQPTDPALAIERDAFFAELNNDPDALAAMEEQLAAAITDRSVDSSMLLENDAFVPAGGLLIQPYVETEEGSVLLDNRLGTGFAVLGINCDPRQLLDEATLRCWEQFETTFLCVASGDPAAQSGLIDSGGALAEFLGLEEPAVVLLRPDRFIMALATPGQANEMLMRAYALLEVPR